MKTIKFLLSAAALLAATSAAALVQPQRINFQGKLIDPSTSLPRNGTFSMTFAIYNVPGGSPATALYTETQSGVTVTNGVFSVQIGTLTALPRELFLGASAYLGVTVSGDTEMKPLQQLIMSPYAFTANQLSDLNEVRLIGGAQYSTFTAAGNLAVPNGITSATGTFTATGGSNYSLTTSSGINMNAGTLDLTGSDGINATGTGITASTGVFKGTGAAVYSLTLSSGVDMNSGTLSMIGSAGLDATGTGIRAATATFTSTVTAFSFSGDGSNLTDVPPYVFMSSSVVSPALTAGTEKVISYSTITFTNPAHKAFVLGSVVLSGGTAGTGVIRLRVSAAGGACSTASTLIHSVRWGLTATANINAYPVIWGLDSRGAVGTYAYCLSVLSTAANSYLDHEMSVIDVSGNSTTGLSP